jgi:hypothetical protein
MPLSLACSCYVEVSTLALGALMGGPGFLEVAQSRL